MQKDERDLLEVLKFELEFLEQGGYGRSPRTPWRPQYIFEDSLTCMNYDSKENPGPCSDCVLMHLVPPERRSEKIPCRHIPFNVFGETLAFPIPVQRSKRDRRNSWRLAAGHHSAFGRRADGYSKGSRQAAGLKPRSVERNASLPGRRSEMCKPGVRDCLSLDRRRQVLPISARSGFGKCGAIQELIRHAESTV